MSRLLLTCVTFAVLAAPALAADTPKAAATRKLLKNKVSVDFQETPLRDAIDELKEKVKGLKVIIDTKGGVSLNQKITYTGNDKTVAEVLDGMFKKNGLGYVVISNRNNAYDGLLKVKQGSERGYEKGQEPKK